MYVLTVAWIVAAIWVCVTRIKSDLLLREVLDAVVEENDLLVKQNKMLKDVFKKYGLEISG
jgi:hypothetical protein